MKHVWMAHCQADPALYDAPLMDVDQIRWLRDEWRSPSGDQNHARMNSRSLWRQYYEQHMQATYGPGASPFRELRPARKISSTESRLDAITALL